MSLDIKAMAVTISAVWGGSATKLRATSHEPRAAWCRGLSCLPVPPTNLCVRNHEPRS